jgi:membrane dipeptidase
MRRIVLCFALLACACVPDPARVHEEAFVVDAHSDALYRMYTHGGDFAEEIPDAQVDIGKLTRGGVDLQFMAVWVPTRYMSKGEGDPDSSALIASRMLDLFETQVAHYGDRIALARTGSEALAVRDTGKIALALGIEGGHMIENSLELLRGFHGRGARYMTLTWTASTEWAIAAREEPDVPPERPGLTGFGREVIATMNEIGMMVDVSHVAEKTFYDVLEVTKDPVIASHSCTAAINPHHRNLTDDQIRRLAENGGVLCINFYPVFLDSAYRNAYSRAEEEFKTEIDSIRTLYRETNWALYMNLRGEILMRRTSRHPVTIDTLIDHIDHVVRIAGADHVGLGSDFDGIDVTPTGLENATTFPGITERLLERGYTAQEVGKIMGGNVLRIFREVSG